MKRKCYTNYSFFSIQKELEDTDLLDLHEHINEKIIGNNFNVKIYTKEFLNSSNPLYQCQNLYKRYDHSVNDLIYIEYQYENKTFYKMYDYNEGHKFCEIGICYLYIVKNSSFIIYNDENLILNINDYLEPNILDNNTFIGFQFTNIDQGKLIEKTDNENEIITSSTNSLFSNARQFKYSTSCFYCFDKISLEIIYGNGNSFNRKGQFTINVLPNYCNKLLSNINRICYTNLTLDSIKNNIISNSSYNNFSYHNNEKIYGINYNLNVYFKEPLENNECNNLLKNYYETNNFILFDITKENKQYIELYAKKDNEYYYVNQNLCEGIFLYNATKVIDINGEYQINLLNYFSDLIPPYINLDISNNLEKYSFLFYRLNEDGNYELFINSNIILNNNFLITFIPDDYKYYKETFKYVLIKRNSTITDYVNVNIQSEIIFNIFPSYCKSYQEMDCISKKNIEEILQILDYDYKNIKNHNGEVIENNDFYIQINKMDNNKKIMLN